MSDSVAKNGHKSCVGASSKSACLLFFSPVIARMTENEALQPSEGSCIHLKAMCPVFTPIDSPMLKIPWI